VGSPGGPSGGPRCRDKLPPRSTLRLRDIRRSRHSVSVKGRSTDPGCARLARVYVSLARVRVGGSCRFLTRQSGALTGWRSCRRAILFRAHGTSSWRLTLHGQLPPGVYRVVVRAYDSAGNKERPARARNIVRFRLR
jgi:hypothetical protein